MTRRYASQVVLLGSILSAGVISAQPGPSSSPIIDNARVRVWLDSAPAGRPEGDRVIVSVNAVGANAVFTTVGAANSKSVAVSGSMVPGGNANSQGNVTASNRTLYVELKAGGAPAMANTSGFPNAFPRPHVKQLLDNARVTVWEYRWNPGEPTPMHFHDKDVVVLYLEDGALQSTTPSGEKTVNEYKPGIVKFNLRDRMHTESLVRGTQRAVMVELK